MLAAFLLTTFVAVLTYFGVVVVRRLAIRDNVFDIPNQRSSHTQPTPRGGGLAIDVVVLAMWIGYTVLLLPSTEWIPRLVFAGAATLIAAISWLDDVYSISNRIRFSTH